MGIRVDIRDPRPYHPCSDAPAYTNGSPLHLFLHKPLSFILIQLRTEKMGLRHFLFHRYAPRGNRHHAEEADKRFGSRPLTCPTYREQGIGNMGERGWLEA